MMNLINQLLAIHWDVAPHIFKAYIEVFDFNLEVRWYGVFFASAFLIGQLIMMRIFRAEGRGEKDADSLTMYMVLSTVIGARLGHCLFYDPEYYLSDPIRILKIYEGGLASHGGAIGILIGLWLFSQRKKYSYLWVLDRIAIVAALGGFFIRFGNLMNSEIVGLPTDLPWAFVFEGSMSLAPADRLIPRHPAQLYESLSCLVLFIFLYFTYWNWKDKLPKGRFFSIFMVYIFGLRFFYEFLKQNQVDFESGLQASLGLNMGQILSIPLVMIGVYFLMKSFEEGKSEKPA